MGLIDLLLKRKKETEEAGEEPTGVKDDLEASLRKAEEERDRRYAKKQQEEKK